MSNLIPRKSINVVNEQSLQSQSAGTNDLIDIHELNNVRDYRFKKRITVYDTFLKRCLQKIKSITRERSYCMYRVPLFTMGVPLFDRVKCIYYMFHSLKKYGFEVIFNPDTSLYISWGHITSYVKDPELKKKQEIDVRTKPLKQEAKKYRDIQDTNNMIKNNFIYNMDDYDSNTKNMFHK
jgi:hypothetical protein